MNTLSNLEYRPKGVVMSNQDEEHEVTDEDTLVGIKGLLDAGERLIGRLDEDIEELKSDYHNNKIGEYKFKEKLQEIQDERASIKKTALTIGGLKKLVRRKMRGDEDHGL